MISQSLSLPLDITWQRFAFSRDMMDDAFNALDFPAKWRSSLAVYAYVVPEAQTAQSYPDARIIYLRLTCSITGWNPNEELINEINLASIGDSLTDLQHSSWEAIQGDRWSETYWACMGAIAQIAVYPSRADLSVDIEEFPHILDFEPKKRELYETATQTSEFLSATSDRLSVQKGTTTLEHTEKSAKAGATIPVPGLPIGVEGEIKKSTDITSVDTQTRDKSRDDRETKSFTTSFNQMYQLFNGYHLGTNRAVFVIAPRPHTVTGSDVVDFNLIEGERKLEGLQDMFVVVHVPKRLSGICVQATLDSGHDVEEEPGKRYIAKVGEDPSTHPDGEDEDPGGGGGGGGGTGGGDEGEGVTRIVVTRRIVRNCAKFAEDGRLVLTGVPAQPEGLFPPVTFEASLGQPIARAMMRRRGKPFRGREDRIEFANALNRYQRRVMNTMVSGVTSGRYHARRFVDTTTFQRLASLSLGRLPTVVDRLAELAVIDSSVAARLTALGFGTVGEVFRADLGTLNPPERQLLSEVRDRVVANVREALPARRT
jgi:hypothetical protein